MITPACGALALAGVGPGLPHASAVREHIPAVYNTSDWGTQAWSEDVRRAEETARAWIERAAEAQAWPERWRDAAEAIITSARGDVDREAVSIWTARAGSWMLGLGLLAHWYDLAVRPAPERAEEFFRRLSRQWFVATTMAEEDVPSGWAKLGKVWAAATEASRTAAKGRRLGDLGLMAYETTRLTTNTVRNKGVPLLLGVTIVAGAGLLGRELGKSG